MLAVAAGGLFESVYYWFNDLLYVSSPVSDKIVIVAIDDLSLGAYGRTVAEWNRGLHADLLDFLSGAGARVVAFDVFFSEPSHGDPNADDRFAAAIEAARRAGTRTVLAVGGGVLHPVEPGSPLSSQKLLLPVSPLEDAASMLGQTGTTPDGDNSIRRVPLTIDSGGTSWLSFSVATYLSYLRIPPEAVPQVVTPGLGTLAVTPQRVIPVDDYDRMLVNYFGPPSTFVHYSYRAVHDREVDPQVFKDKIVLVGAYNATGITDLYRTPIARSTLMSGIEIHANTLETLIQNQPLTAQNPVSIAVTIVIVALASGQLFMRVRWYWGVLEYVLILVAMFAAASLLFSLGHFIAALWYPVITLTLTGVGSLMLNLQYELQRRRALQEILDGITRLDAQRLVLDDVLRSVASDVQRLIRPSTVAISLWDEDAHRLEIAYTVAAPPPDLYEAAASAVARMAPVIDWGRAILPMSFQGRPLGAIAVAGSISAYQRDLLRAVAEYAAPAIANSRMVTRQRRQSELLNAILTSSPNPILVLDTGRRVMRTNRAAERLFMLDRTSEVPSAEDLFPDEDHVPELLAKSSEFRQEVRIGSEKFMVNGGILPGIGWVLALSDITLLKELDSLKTQMIRMASHDLKNPLSIILGYTEFILSGQMTLELSHIETIHQSARQMQNIITDLLNIERIRARQDERELLELGPLLEAVVAEYAAQAGSKQQSLTLRQPDTAIAIRGDARDLHEAFGNLVGNAIKYTPEAGTITLQVTVERAKVRIAIQDTGYGIPVEAQGKLFQPFYRVKTRETAHIAGTGLGLNLVKAVIDAHQGQVWVESEPGRGSTFYVELPL